jgi:hypothetical protein
MAIHDAGTIHDAIRGHAKTRVEKRNYGFSLGKLGIGYSVEREVVRPEKAQSATEKVKDHKDFAREMLLAMRRRMDFRAASGGRDRPAAGGSMPLAMRTALKAYASSMTMAVQPPQPSRLIAVA